MKEHFHLEVLLSLVKECFEKKKLSRVLKLQGKLSHLIPSLVKAEKRKERHWEVHPPRQR